MVDGNRSVNSVRFRWHTAAVVAATAAAVHTHCTAHCTLDGGNRLLPVLSAVVWRSAALAAAAQYGAGGQLLHHLGVCIRLLKHPRCQSIMASGSGAENQYYGNFLS